MSLARAAVAALLTALSATPLAAQAGGGGTLVGVVVSRGTGLALPYSVVSLPGVKREKFATDSGAFVFTDVPPGPTVLRVRRLGYAPRDLAVEVHNATDTLRIELDRIALRLTAVEVSEFAPCFDPGPPGLNADTSLATVYSQLVINAEQFRLMSEVYPFSYGLVSNMALVGKDGVRTEEELDTARVQSSGAWKYQPGQVLRRAIAGKRKGLMLRVPTLLNFADPDFSRSHCFHNSGLVTAVDGDFIRIDAIAAERLKSTDVNATILLDPNTFQIRRTIVHLWRGPKFADMTDLEVTTEFREVLESIPIISHVTSRRSFDPKARSSKIAYSLEEQELFDFTWLGQKPGEERKP